MPVAEILDKCAGEEQGGGRGSTSASARGASGDDIRKTGRNVGEGLRARWSVVIHQDKNGAELWTKGVLPLIKDVQT